MNSVPQNTKSAPNPAPISPGLFDANWSDTHWNALLVKLIDSGILTWKEIGSLTLGHLNPSQVGTSLASSDGFKRKYGKGNTMSIVMKWAYEQNGQCEDCGTRLELQADHIKGKETYKDPLDADFIENMTLRCRRCNVVKRPTHEFGGITHLTAESALMWILFVIRPRTFSDYVTLCRLYGMTMADIRFQEAWAMARWLNNSKPSLYEIEEDEKYLYNIEIWPDNSITRVRNSEQSKPSAQILYSNVPGTDHLGFIAQSSDDVLRIYEFSVAEIPFSNYDLGARDPQSLAIRYTPPDRDAQPPRPQILEPLAPTGLKLLCHCIRKDNEKYLICSSRGQQEVDNSRWNGKLLKKSVLVDGLSIGTKRLSE